MSKTPERKSKLPTILEHAPVGLFFIAIAIALSFLGAMIVKMIKEDDTQGIYYGGTPEQYRKRYTQMMSGGSSGYGAKKPSPPPSSLKSTRPGR